MKRMILTTLLVALAHMGVDGEPLERRFENPPDAFRPWVFWHWTNGNVTRDGITKDLEGMKEVGIGGVILFRLSGPQWAPPGPLKTGIEHQLPMIAWAAGEADRLGIEFSLVIDYGYGSGGPHIPPDLSMQQVYHSETDVQGGRLVTIELPEPGLEDAKKAAMKKVWLRPGARVVPRVLRDFEEADCYRDIAVFAIPMKNKATLAKLEAYNGLGHRQMPPLGVNAAGLLRDEIIDLTDKVDGKGILTWDAPEGSWTVVRMGYASNFKLTRPCPASEVGLECDRLHPRGIDKHFDHRLKPVLEKLNGKGKGLVDYIFIDSWEAHSQNWTEGFAEEFEKRRGYDPAPWLPVLAGRVVNNGEQSERFLWDLRQTVGEAMVANYIDHLEERLEPYGAKLFFEPYGSMCVDSLTWAGRGAFPVGEFWSQNRRIPESPGLPAELNEINWHMTMKGFASIANTYGLSLINL